MTDEKAKSAPAKTLSANDAGKSVAPRAQLADVGEEEKKKKANKPSKDSEALKPKKDSKDKDKDAEVPELEGFPKIVMSPPKGSQATNCPKAPISPPKGSQATFACPPVSEMTVNEKDQSVPAKVERAVRNHRVPDTCYEVLNFVIELEKPYVLGLGLKKDMVSSVKGISCQNLIHTGDILISINGSPIGEDSVKNKEIYSKIGAKVKISLIRLKQRPPQRAILPKGYEALENHEYQWSVMYLMRGLNLGLHAREIDGKVYVGQVMPDTIASMSLEFGECVIDVDGVLIDNVQLLNTTIVQRMNRSGMARLCLEVPVIDPLRNALRCKILKAMGDPVEPDPYMTPEAIQHADKATQVLKTAKEPKSIYREEGAKKKKKLGIFPLNPKLKWCEKTNETGIVIDNPSKLLVKAPPMRNLEAEEALKKQLGGG